MTTPATNKWQIVPHDGYMSDDTPPLQIIDGEGKTVACNTTFYPTAITAVHASTIVAAVNEVAELRDQLATALKDRDHWKANHSEMVQRNSVLRERPDLPVDRLPSIARYEVQLATARAALLTAKKLADVMEGLCACQSDDEWVWAAQAEINAALGGQS